MTKKKKKCEEKGKLLNEKTKRCIVTGIPVVKKSVKAKKSISEQKKKCEEKEMSNTEIWDKISSIQEEMTAFRKMKLSKVIERCQELNLV